VERLQIERGAGGAVCTGVIFTGGGTRYSASASGDTILAAGAIGSPHILQHSGIGAAERLQALGIAPVAERAGVGENLQDHLQLRMIYKLGRGARTLNTLAANWWGKLRIGAQYALWQSGPLSMAPSQLGAFAYSGPGLATPDLEYHVQPLSLEKFGDPLHAFPAFTASVCQLRPTSRGHVRIASADADAPPKISPMYLSTAHDRQVAAAALALTRQIVAAPALARFAPEEYRPGAQYRTEQELSDAAGAIGTTIFHPVGTCKMGRADDASAVVDSQLRVIGVQKLRIADASIMPFITSGNTNSPTIMIAEKAAELIKKANWNKGV